MTKSSKQQRIVSHLKKTILQFMNGRRYQPMLEEDLIDRLQISSQMASLFKTAVKDLLLEEEIEIHKKKLCLKKSRDEIVTGILRVHHKGFGFLIPDIPSHLSQDVFIPKHLTDNAVDGDHVEAILLSENYGEKGPEGKVLSVLKRAHKHLAGTITHITSAGTASAYVPLLGTSKPVTIPSSALNNTRLIPGDRVVLKVLEWGKQQNPTTAEISHILGHISNPAIDVAAAIEEFDLHSIFTKEAITQAKSYKKKVPSKDLKKEWIFPIWNALRSIPTPLKILMTHYH